MSKFKLHDNGLLKYYKQYANKGYLDLDAIKLNNKSSIFSCHHDVYRVKSPDGEFFIKASPIFYSTSEKIKLERDREIMSGQIYNEAGVKGAVYTPVMYFGGSIKSSNFFEENFPQDMYERYKSHAIVHALISNSVREAGSQTLSNFYINEQNTPQLYFDRVEKLSRINAEENILKHYDDHFLEQLLKVRVLDVATGFNDRQYNNAYVTFEPLNPEDPIYPDSKLTDISVFDYEESRFRQKEKYYHEFRNNEKMLTREEMLQEFRENEYVERYLNKPALAEKIGNIDVEAIAEAVTEATASENSDGYTIETSEIEFLKRSCEEVAKNLEQ